MLTLVHVLKYLSDNNGFFDVRPLVVPYDILLGIYGEWTDDEYCYTTRTSCSRSLESIITSDSAYEVFEISFKIYLMSTVPETDISY